MGTRKERQERKIGVFRYYIRHIWGMAFICFGMNVGDYLVNGRISLLFVIISLIVSFLFPVIAWGINEGRFHRYLLGHDKSQI